MQIPTSRTFLPTVTQDPDDRRNRGYVHFRQDPRFHIQHPNTATMSHARTFLAPRRAYVHSGFGARYTPSTNKRTRRSLKQIAGGLAIRPRKLGARGAQATAAISRDVEFAGVFGLSREANFRNYLRTRFRPRDSRNPSRKSPPGPPPLTRRLPGCVIARLVITRRENNTAGTGSVQPARRAWASLSTGNPGAGCIGGLLCSIDYEPGS